MADFVLLFQRPSSSSDVAWARLIAHVRGCLTATGLQIVEEKEKFSTGVRRRGIKRAMTLTATSRAFDSEADHLEFQKPMLGIDAISGVEREETYVQITIWQCPIMPTWEPWRHAPYM